jgi:arginine exporter protein ArgO
MKHDLEKEFNEQMKENVKSRAGFKATAVVVFMYSVFFAACFFNLKLILTITFLASILVFMVVFSFLLWMGLRKHFEEKRYKKKIKKLKKLHKKLHNQDLT